MLGALSALTSLTGCFEPGTDAYIPAGPPDNGFSSTGGTKLFEGKVVSSPSKVAPIAGGTLLVTKDGHAIVSDPDRDQVYVVDVGAKSVVPVSLEEGDEPGRAVEGPEGTVYVATRRGGVVVAVDVASARAKRIPVCAAPRGLVYDKANSSLYVACRSGLLVTIDTGTQEVTARVQLEPDLRDVVITGDDLVVTRFKSAEVMVVSRKGEILRRATPKLSNAAGLFTPRVAYRTLAAPGGGVLVGHVDSSNVELPSGAGAYYGAPCGGSVADLSLTLMTTNEPTSGATPGLAVSTRFTEAMGGMSGPLDLALTADGTKLAILATGNAWAPDRIAKPNLYIAASSALQPTGGGLNLSCASVGGTPGAITAQGEPVAVAFDQGNNWIVQSRQPAQLEVQGGTIIPLAGDDRTDTGMQMFHMNTGGGIACQSCHPEAGEDGHTWNFSIGLRRSQDLRGGASQRAPFHWSGDLVDFDHLFEEVMMKRMSLAAQVSPEQKTALRDWIDSVPRELSADDLDADAVERGRALFEDSKTACSTCHSGSDYSDNLPHDVGTGASFITPSLVGVNTRAPLFHDGCALTLTGRFGPCGGGDAHGVTSHLTEEQRSDLVTYMRSL